MSSSPLGYMRWLLLWIACAVITGIIATSKGRDSRHWGLWGLLLGPLGILVAAVLAPDQQELARRAAAWGDVRKCPGCGDLVGHEAASCEVCGASLT